MASGCAIVASNTEPVKEVIQHGENGILVDFFSPTAIINGINKTLNNQADTHSLRQAAIQTAQEYSLQHGLAQYLELILGDDSHAISEQTALKNKIVYQANINTNKMRRKSDRLHEMDLTCREIEVFQCMINGLADKDISTELNIAPKTVSHHVSNIIHKLGANNRMHAVAKVFNA